METSQPNEATLRSFLIATRRLHWDTITLENRGVPKEVVAFLQKAEKCLIEIVYFNPCYGKTHAIVNSWVDSFYNEEVQITHEKEISDERQAHLWASCNSLSMADTITHCFDDIHLNSFLWYQYDSKGEVANLISQAIFKFGQWLKERQKINDSVPKSMKQEIDEAMKPKG